MGLYDDFMNDSDGVLEGEKLEEKKDEKNNQTSEKIETEKDEKLGMWQFIHHENGNVTMGEEMFEKLTGRLLP